MRTLDRLIGPLVVATAAALLGALGMIFFYAPVEQTMGIVQKIFYSHVPAALTMYACFITTSVASALYLMRPSRTYDLVARSAAELGMIFCIYVLISGPLWAYKAWGKPWVWDPQLTATFVLFLLYGGYTLLRALSPDTHSIRQIGALLSIIAVVDIPIIHYAVKKWGGLHPVVERSGGGGLAPDARLTFLVCLGAFFLLFLTLMALSVRARLTRQRVDALQLDLADATHGLS